MKKLTLFSALFLLLFLPLFSAQTYSDIGQLVELDIKAKSLARAEINNSTSVTIITKEEIESYNVSTVAQLIGKATGTTFSSYGSEGAAQSIQIRGISSSKILIYIDGVPMTSAHDASFDLSTIPLSSVESIEIIRSGHGNLGRTNGIGGIVNIILKKDVDIASPFSLSFENGSFLPLAYGSEDKKNWLSLVDSQKLSLGYSTKIKNFNLSANAGGVLAQNNYTYRDGGALALREDSEFKKIDGSIALNGNITDNLSLNSQNIIAFSRLETPGSLTYITVGNWQQDLSVTTLNNLTLKNKAPYLDNLSFSLLYDYRQTFFNDLIYGESTHNKHKGNIGFNQKWNVGQNYSLESGLNLAIDYVDSSEIDQHTRLSPSLFATGSIYLFSGKLSVHP
ncbi:MAG: TonB-dependent receptor plug domain-containing protein, partial [Sphaerochaetaceae bacterium]